MAPSKNIYLHMCRECGEYKYEDQPCYVCEEEKRKMSELTPVGWAYVQGKSVGGIAQDKEFMDEIYGQCAGDVVPVYLHPPHLSSDSDKDALVAELERLLRDFRESFDAVRDDILNQRGPFEDCVDNMWLNSVLDFLDFGFQTSLEESEHALAALSRAETTEPLPAPPALAALPRKEEG